MLSMHQESKCAPCFAESVGDCTGSRPVLSIVFPSNRAPTSLRLMYWPLVRSKVRETLKLSSLTLNRSPTPRARPGVVRPSMSYSTVKGMEISWVSLSCKSADGKRRSLGSCSLGWATQPWSCRTVPSSFEVHYKEGVRDDASRLIIGDRPENDIAEGSADPFSSRLHISRGSRCTSRRHVL